MITRSRLATLFFLLAFVFFIPSAAAANVHFVVEPTVTVDLENFTVDVEGKLAGLGNKDVIVTVEVNGTAEIWLYNPGGNLPAGKNKVPFYSVGQTVVHPDPKNGTVSFSLTVDFSDAIEGTLATAILPKPNWTAVLQDLDVTSVVVTVEQNGKVVLSETFYP
jgi:hypothetical protein